MIECQCGRRVEEHRRAPEAIWCAREWSEDT
jgi:hypothetical protein